MRPVLILTGGPAAGKTTCARELAGVRERCAVVDVDDIRQLIVAGHVPPWRGAEGAFQHRMGVVNACALAHNCRAGGFEVIIADMVSEEVWPVYRARLPGALVVHLRISEVQARARAASRPRYLTDAEFGDLWRSGDSAARWQHDLMVDGLTVAQQVAAIEAVWSSAG